MSPREARDATSDLYVKTITFEVINIFMINIFIVYKTTHVPSGRFYIGRHVTQDLDDGYLGSGTIISRLLKSYPRSEFVREVLYLASTGKEMLDVEEQYISEVLDYPLCMNCTVGDPSTRGIIRHSQASKQKMSLSRKGKRHSPESKKKMFLSKLGKQHSSSTKQKISIYAQNRSEQHRKAHGAAIASKWRENRADWSRSFLTRPPVGESTRRKHSLRQSGSGNVRALNWIIETDDGSVIKKKSLKDWCVQHQIKYTSLLYTEKSKKIYQGVKVRREDV